jgi:NADH-quinone oxidoreductase subunit G
MATIQINGIDYTLPDHEKLNAIQAAARFGVEIPYYCWHPALSVVANCRMCEVEIGTKDPASGEVKWIPKLVPGCQTPAKDGTAIRTDSEKVKNHQKMIMEFLLLNHPLDCPVCDQAGECGLQDYSYERGQAVHRFVEERTINPRKQVSPTIQLNQDRCIMCTRCVRFTREISQTGELQVIRRGHHAEIDVFADLAVDNPLSGNVVDLCPVGALLDTTTLHAQRAWYLTKHDGICTRCSSGCNLSVETNKGRVWRYKPRHNPEVNDYWICDAGRYSAGDAHAEDLLPGCFRLETPGADHVAIEPLEAVAELGRRLHTIAAEGGAILGVIGPYQTVEEAFWLASYLKSLGDRITLALGPVTFEGVDRIFAPDKRTGRSGDTSFVVPRSFVIRAEKAPNRLGVEAVLRHFQGEVIGFKAALEQVAAGRFQAVHLAIGSPIDWIDQTTAEMIRNHVSFVSLTDTRISPLAHLADLVLAGATAVEKAGCYVNAQGRLQRSKAALPPRPGTLPDLDIAALLLGRADLPPKSSQALAELGQTIPAFQAVRDGVVPPLGVVLEPLKPDGSALDNGAPPAPDGFEPFQDTWFLPKQERVEVSF